ncbi:MAG: hypothetical protein LIO87_05065 [Eubacterium sp.]|nr:hypothetical protein [Eubacterium sp.]
MSSGGYSGVTYGNQLSLENQEAEVTAKKNEAEVQERIQFLKNELPKTSPIHIPENATIKDQQKRGYQQVKYEWTSKDGYKYLSRWHTHTPGAPNYSQNTWVVERKKPGIGYGKTPRGPVEEVMVGKNIWIKKSEWKKAIAARKSGNATKQQKEWLDNGHWKV